MSTGNEKLASISEIIRLAKEQGIYLGKGNPQNRLRYFIKIGFLPHMERRKNPATGKVEGHLPLSTLETLKKIQELESQCLRIETIKGWFEADKIRQAELGKAPIQQLNGLTAKITQPMTSAVEKLTEIQQTQVQETSFLKQSLREFLTRTSQPITPPTEVPLNGTKTGPFSRVSLAGILALILLGAASFFLVPRLVTNPIKNEIKNLALKLNLQQPQQATTNNYYQTTNNYNNQLPVDEKGFLKLSGVSIGDGYVLLDSSGNIKFLGKVTGGLVDTTGENLLLNPGFEINPSGKPTFWEYALVANEGNTFVGQDFIHSDKNSNKFYFNISSPHVFGTSPGRNCQKRKNQPRQLSEVRRL